MITRVLIACMTGAWLLAQDALRWSPARPLRWSDYRGTPQVASPASAMTAYLTSYNDGCRDGAYWRDVFVAFLPDQSWVKSEVLFRGGGLVLAHEQGHFDLAEVHARKLRRALDALGKPCEMGDSRRNEIAAQMLDEDRREQARYDNETHFGAAPTQSDWSRRIRRELDQLKTWTK